MPSDTPGTGVPARYGDGRTAVSRPVRVRLGESGLEIEIGGTAKRLWPYAEIETATPLGPASVEALLHRVARAGDADADDGATLFVADRELVQGLIARHGHLTARRERWRFAKPGLAAAAVIGAITLTIWLTNISPSRVVAGLIPQSLWEKFGTQMLAGLAKGHRECTAPEGVAALDRLMRRLVEGDYRSQGYEAKVVEWNLLNAFAMPGRRLVLTSRLVETAGSAEEIAGVLAHEIGHGIERHPETAIVRVLGLATLAKLFASGFGDTVSNASVLLVQLRYNRDGEREADQRAVELLQAAQIRVKPLATFLLRIKKTYGGSGTEPLGGILSTHPDIDERIARIDALADTPARPAMSPADLAALRAICKR